MSALRVFWRALRDSFEELIALLGINILYTLLCVPLPALALVLLNGGAWVGALLALLLAVLTFGPASVGLTAVAERIYEGRTVSLGDFFGAMRAGARLGWQLYGLWMLGLVVLLLNIGFYAQLNASISPYLMVLFSYVLIIWMSLLTTIGPLTHIQEAPSLRVTFRNALLLAFGRPVFGILTQILMVIIVVISLIFPPLLLLYTPGLLAVWGFRATRTLIGDVIARRESEQARQAAEAEAATADKRRGGQVRPRD